MEKKDDSSFFQQLMEVITAAGDKNCPQESDPAVKAFFAGSNQGHAPECRMPRQITPAPRPVPPPARQPRTEAVPPPMAVPPPAPARFTPATLKLTEVPEFAAAADLTELRQALGECRRCALGQTRQNLVFGEGNPHADLMFIGEGPGADEDAQGRPFVGESGALLTKIISAMHLTREQVFIANVVKCRPPNNRQPQNEEAAACLPVLHAQIRLIQPKAIVTLGATAAKGLLQTNLGINAIRGRWTEWNGIPVMPTFHPAYLLRDPSRKREVWEDMKLVMARLGL